MNFKVRNKSNINAAKDISLQFFLPTMFDNGAELTLVNFCKSFFHYFNTTLSGQFFAVATQKSKTNTKHSKTHLCMCVFLMKLYLEVCWKKKTAVAEVIKDIPVIIYMRLNTWRAPKYVTLPHDHRGNHHS